MENTAGNHKPELLLEGIHAKTAEYYRKSKNVWYKANRDASFRIAKHR